MSFSMAGGGPSRPQINVTPLIDVLLTLIIVFMLVVSQQKKDEKGLDAQIPQPKTPASDAIQPSTIVLQVVWTADGQAPTLKINQEAIRREDLEERLEEIFLKRAEKVAFVRGDDDVDFEYVADVIDVARHAGVLRVGLLTRDRGVLGE
jgi:biopolymer transport protein TolR